MLKKAAITFGVIFVLIGLLGFIPVFTPNNHLLGIFHVNGVHNLIHLLSGIAALVAGSSSESASRTYFRVFGVIYALVTLLGLMEGDGAILGIVANNTADVLLHLAIAGSALYLGFARKDPVIAR